MTEHAQLRRLYASPDGSGRILATTSTGVVPLLHYTCQTTSATAFGGGSLRKSSARRCEVSTTELPVMMKHRDDDDVTQATNNNNNNNDDAPTSPLVRLPFPALSLSWCPFMSGADNASFLTACRSQPLQMWDMEDGELRASYVCHNDAGIHAHPQASLWLASNHNHIFGGYGGFEDKQQLRMFDVLHEGDAAVWSYATSHAHGRVSYLACSAADAPHTQLCHMGFLNHGVVESVDVRHRCPALRLRGLRSGVASIKTSVQEPHHVYAAGRCGDGRILAWDLRKPTEVLRVLARPLTSQQVCDFDFARIGSAHVVVAGSSEGGVLVYDVKDDDVDGDEVHHHHHHHRGEEEVVGRVWSKELGPTGGVCALADGGVAVTVGERSFALDAAAHKRRTNFERKLRESYDGSAPRKTTTPSPAKHDSDDDDDVLHQRTKRVRQPMDDDDESSDEPAAEGRSTLPRAVALHW